MWTANFKISKYLSNRTISQRLLSPGYRFAITKKLAKATNCTDVLLFDHVHPTDPSLGKGLKTSTGYEKCLIASIPFTSNMNVHVLLQVPPLPTEMAFAQELYARVPNRKQLCVWIEDKNKEKFIDIYDLYTNDQSAYRELVKKTLENPPASSNVYHVNAAIKLINSHISGKVLILPFQMTDWHKKIFKTLVNEGKVSLPDSADPWINKGQAHKYFESHGAGDLRPFSKFISMESIRENTEVNREKAAQRVESLCREMQRQGKTPFIKLAANGLAGFGIITPQDNPLLNSSLPKEQQTIQFKKVVANILHGVLFIPDALVEEYVPALTDNEGKKEYILSGIIINKKFYLWSISRAFISKEGIYQGVIVSPYLTDIGLTQDCLIKADHEGERLAAAMSESGYNVGYIAKDFMLTIDNDGQERHVYHDDNDRRGGRTVADVASALTQRGYCDHAYILTVPQEKEYTDFIIELTNELKAKGLFIYGTGSVYSPKKTISLRILAPLDLIRDQINADTTLSRDEIIKNFVNSILERYQ